MTKKADRKEHLADLRRASGDKQTTRARTVADFAAAGINVIAEPAEGG